MWDQNRNGVQGRVAKKVAVGFRPALAHRWHRKRLARSWMHVVATCGS